MRPKITLSSEMMKPAADAALRVNILPLRNLLPLFHFKKLFLP
jgi:hypothetical protein